MSTNRYDINVDENNRIRSSARLLYISSAKYGGDWHSMPHTHTCSELFYVTAGRGQFRIENQLYPVAAKDLIIVNPHVEHTEVSLNALPLEYIVLGIDGLELSIRDSDENRFCIVNFHNAQDKILAHLRGILHEIEAKEPGYETICQDLLDILIIYLMRQTDFSATMTPIRSNSSRLCTMVHHYIDMHYKEAVTLDLLAEISHVSKYYMVHAFTEEYGISPINYMIQKRIEEAKQTLCLDNYSISLISQLLGFSSPSYFSQSFKKLTGLSPNEYRKLRKDASREPENLDNNNTNEIQ